MSKVKKNCLHCTTEFETTQKEINRGFGLYCSIRCSSTRHAKILRDKRVDNATCAYCSATFYCVPKRLKASKTGLVFCCRRCKDQAQRLEGISAIQPPHYGTSKIIPYRNIAFRHYINQCNRCGYAKCMSCLEVHHKDRNRQNNNVDNLEILCRNCHGEEHHLEKTEEMALPPGDDPGTLRLTSERSTN